MYGQNSQQEGGTIHGERGIDAQHRFSRRAMLGGLAGLVGAGVAGSSLPFGPAQATPTARVLPTATHILPSPPASPTPTPAPQGTTLYIYQGHSNRVNTAVWAPGGKCIASGSGIDTTVQIWDALSGANVVTHHGYGDSGATVAWAPDGKRLASADRTDLNHADDVQVWDAASGQTLKTYPVHMRSPAPGPVNGLSWSPDGKYLASASYDYTVRVWEVAIENIRFFYSDPHGYLMTCVAWSPDGKRIASGSVDTTVQIWDALSGKLSYTYTGHNATVYAAVWSPDGMYIASGGDDKTVQVWQAV
jgi:WD40 repeat protein